VNNIEGWRPGGGLELQEKKRVWKDTPRDPLEKAGWGRAGDGGEWAYNNTAPTKKEEYQMKNLRRGNVIRKVGRVQAQKRTTLSGTMRPQKSLENGLGRRSSA